MNSSRRLFVVDAAASAITLMLVACGGGGDDGPPPPPAPAPAPAPAATGRCTRMRRHRRHIRKSRPHPGTCSGGRRFDCRQGLRHHRGGRPQPSGDADCSSTRTTEDPNSGHRCLVGGRRRPHAPGDCQLHAGIGIASPTRGRDLRPTTGAARSGLTTRPAARPSACWPTAPGLERHPRAAPHRARAARA